MKDLDAIDDLSTALAKERAPLFQRVYPFFACFAAVARTRKALLFEAPQAWHRLTVDQRRCQGAGPAPVETEKLPLRVALNLQRQLQRQATRVKLVHLKRLFEDRNPMESRI